MPRALFLWSERKLKLPKIVARYTNARVFPNLHTATMRDMIDTETKTPGWEQRKLDWNWLMEVQLVNDSETPTTIDHVGAKVRINRETKKAKLVDELSKFIIDMGYDANCKSCSFSGEQYRQLPDLLKTLQDKPLTKGIGYRGWIGFEVKQISQGDINRAKLDMSFVDALGDEHRVNHSKRAEQAWDNSFLIQEQ